MVLPHVVIHIGHLNEALVAVGAGVGLLARVLRAHVRVEATLLGKRLIAVLADVLGEVRVLVIHDQALLRLRRRPTAPRHLAGPGRPVVGHDVGKVRERMRRAHCGKGKVPVPFPNPFNFPSLIQGCQDQDLQRVSVVELVRLGV